MALSINEMISKNNKISVVLSEIVVYIWFATIYLYKE